jgi:hypothetical protein
MPDLYNRDMVERDFIEGYSLYRRDRETTKEGGVAIHVSNKFISWGCQQWIE